jgi:hypothetical protein
MAEEVKPIIEQCKEAHHCRCDSVTQCGIFTHPSGEVQNALNVLMDAMMKFDSITNSKSVLTFESRHPTGVFSSITTRI